MSKQNLNYVSSEKIFYLCEVCGKEFKERKVLNRHSIIHSGVKPYRCDICPRTFFRKQGLKIHKFVHTGEQTEVCDICQRSFPKSYIKKHLITHTGKKSCICEICGNGFSSKYSLRAHMFTHTGERPYACDMCPKAFATKSKLNKHTKSHVTDKKSSTMQERSTSNTNLNSDMFVKSISFDDSRREQFKNSAENVLSCTTGSSFSIHIAEEGISENSNLTERFIKYCEENSLTYSLEKSHSIDNKKIEFSKDFDFSGELPTELKNMNSDTENSAIPVYIQEDSILKLNITFKSTEQENLYKCKICQKCFKEKLSLDKHQLTHIEDKPHICDICQKRFKHNYVLVNHKITHFPFTCDVCRKKFSQKSQLDNHSQTHLGEKPFVCDVCQEGFTSLTNMNKHSLNHIGEKPHSCHVCQRRFASVDSLNRHLQIHAGEDPHYCDVCLKGFPSKAVLVEHLLTHSKPIICLCAGCQNKSSLDHPDMGVRFCLITKKKSYVCQVCSKRFFKKSSLVRHVLFHSGIKAFQCNLCDRSFDIKVGLVKHLLTHTDVDNPEIKTTSEDSPKNDIVKCRRKALVLPCNTCGKIFSRKISLKRHLLIHSTNINKLFQCDVCQKGFPSKPSLKRHIERHAKVKCCTCELCKKEFSDIYALKRHNRLVHADKNTKGNNILKTNSI